jgi:serine/threonine-protein kinase HipA
MPSALFDAARSDHNSRARAPRLYGRADRLTRAHFVEAGERLGLRPRATSRMIDSIVDAAQEWPVRCGDIGFDDRQTELLAQMLHNRIGRLKQAEA